MAMVTRSMLASRGRFFPDNDDYGVPWEVQYLCVGWSLYDTSAHLAFPIIVSVNRKFKAFMERLFARHGHIAYPYGVSFDRFFGVYGAHLAPLGAFTASFFKFDFPVLWIGRHTADKKSVVVHQEHQNVLVCVQSVLNIHLKLPEFNQQLSKDDPIWRKQHLSTPLVVDRDNYMLTLMRRPIGKDKKVKIGWVLSTAAGFTDLLFTYNISAFLYLDAN